MKSFSKKYFVLLLIVLVVFVTGCTTGQFPGENFVTTPVVTKVTDGEILEGSGIDIIKFTLNSMESFFVASEYIEVSKGCGYRLYEDIDGKTEIKTKIIKIEDLETECYLTVFNELNETKTYKVIITFKELLVTFVINDQKFIETFYMGELLFYKELSFDLDEICKGLDLIGISFNGVDVIDMEDIDDDYMVTEDLTIYLITENHVHCFINDICYCGEISPEHIHNFINGTCLCGEEDPNFVSMIDRELDAKFKGFTKGKKLYLTTCGQCDVEKIQSVIYSIDEDANIYNPATGGAVTGAITFTRNDLLSASDVETGSVVFLVTGTSSKGLGSAGVSVPDEMERARAFAVRAAKGEITLIVLHVGGSARRGSMSDPILDIACPKADLLLVIESGNVDGYFTNIAEANNVPLYLYSKPNTLMLAFKTLFDIE